jgi:hypothetical protein
MQEEFIFPCLARKILFQFDDYLMVMANKELETCCLLWYDAMQFDRLVPSICRKQLLPTS